MDADERRRSRPGQRLRERQPDQQRPDQSGPTGHGDGVVTGAAIRQRALDNAADVANVLSCRELGYHAAPDAMDLNLRGDDARAQTPRTFGVAGLFDQRRRGFIARGFDAEHYHVSKESSRFELSGEV